MPKGSRGGAGGGGDAGGNLNIISSKSLVSERERYQSEVDSMLSVLRDVENDYGAVVEDLLVSEIKDSGRGTTLGYYDDAGNVGINQKVFTNALGANTTYDNNVKSGFHPSRGDKSALQAVLAHELGHRLAYIAAGNDWFKESTNSGEIIKRAARSTGYQNRVKQFRSKISGYADYNNSEAVAESFADVYCNGNNAKAESKAVVNELNKYFRR